MTESLRDLRIFAAVYEERSFTTAATREHATQSGVSQHIQRLEGRLDVKLFSRAVGVGVQPTPAGDAYYQACVEVLRAHENAKRSVKAFGKGLDGQITVGLVPTISRSSLAPALARFVEENPNVLVRIAEAYSDTLIEGVKAGELDFAIAIESPAHVGLKSTPIALTPEVLVAGRRLGLRHMEPVRLRELGPLNVVVPIHSKARRTSLETYFAMHGGMPRRKLELDVTFGTLDFIARTDWVTVLPCIMMLPNIENGELSLNPLVDPPLMLPLVLVEPARHPLSDSAVAFLAVLREETRRMAEHVAGLLSM